VNPTEYLNFTRPNTTLVALQKIMHLTRELSQEQELLPNLPGAMLEKTPDKFTRGKPLTISLSSLRAGEIF